MVRGMNTSSAMAAFERMEEKVLMQEARSQSIAELAGADLETQFAKLEAGSDVDDELAAMEAQMNLPGASPTQQALPQQLKSPNSNTGNNEVVDAELDSLRRQLDQL
jgi:phage shock protein A